VRVVSLVFYVFFIHFSFYKKINISAEIKKWYGWLMAFFICFVISFASYYVLVNFSFFNSAWDYAISFSMSFFIFFIAWFGYLQPQVFNGFDLKEILFKPKYKSSNLTEQASKSLIHSANQLMQAQQVYQESELSLEQLAEMLGTTKHNLSQAINENTQLNFFEYVNRFRIEEAQHLLSETSKQQCNVIDIAYMVGFNNKVSFYNTFRKITGTTPSEFRRKYQSPHQATKA
jgi:AraC-like DNA-binding protein